jgi:hypothetical protein
LIETKVILDILRKFNGMSKLQIGIEKLQRHVSNHTALDATIQYNEASELIRVKLTPVDLVSLLDSARIKVSSQTYKFLIAREDYIALNLIANRGYIININGLKFQTVLGNKGTVVDNDNHNGFVVISANVIQ